MKKDWEIKTLEEVCDVVSGFGFPKTYQGEKSGEIPFLKVSDMNLAGNEKYINTANHYVSVDTLKKIKAKSFPKNTIIFPKIGAAIGTNKKRITTVESTFDNNVMGLAVISDGLDLDYLYAWITNFDLNNWASKSELPSMRKSEVEQEKIPVPPLTEQKRIVKILDEKFGSIEELKKVTEQQIIDARELFESRLSRMFAELIENCDQKQLGDFCTRVSVGHVGLTTEFYCGSNVGVPFIRSQNVRSGFLDWKGVQYITRDFHKKLKKSQLQKEDLLFVRVGANRGDCCVLRDQLDDVNCANIVFARLKEGNSSFFELYCRSDVGRKQLLGMSVGAAQGVINTKSVAGLVVPYPSEDIQTKVVGELDELLEKTKALEAIFLRKISDLGELKKSYLEQAFSGEL